MFSYRHIYFRQVALFALAHRTLRIKASYRENIARISSCLRGLRTRKFQRPKVLLFLKKYLRPLSFLLTKKLLVQIPSQACLPRCSALVEVQSEQQCPLERLALEQALAPKLVRELARSQVQLELEPQVQVQLELEPLVQAQALPQRLPELEQYFQRSCPKPQLHRHRYKGPDHSQGPQLELCQTHPKALDKTPQALKLELGLQVRRAQQVLVLALQASLELTEQQELAQQEQLAPEQMSEQHVFLARLPLQQGSIQHI